MPRRLTIGKRVVGEGEPALIVAELSANHGGSLDRALQIVHLAHQAGADAIKLQTYTPDTMTIDCDAEWFRVRGGLWDGRTLYDLYREAHTPWEWHRPIFEEAQRLGLLAFSTPFDASAVDFLETFAPPCYKIASFELGDIPLLERVAATRRPVILSTGMGSEEEIALAIATLRDGGADQIALLHCVSAYPAEPRQFHLRNIVALGDRFDLVTGLSDHSPGDLIACAALPLGAAIIEKHFCRSRDDGGPDAPFSMEPADFAQMVLAIRDVEAALGAPQFGAGEAERENLVFRRSLVAVRDIAAGERFCSANVRVIRPGYGLPPRELPRVIGARAAHAIRRGTPLSWEMLEVTV